MKERLTITERLKIYLLERYILTKESKWELVKVVIKNKGEVYNHKLSYCRVDIHQFNSKNYIFIYKKLRS